jgi:hypothetical protein
MHAFSRRLFSICMLIVLGVNSVMKIELASKTYIVVLEVDFEKEKEGKEGEEKKESEEDLKFLQTDFWFIPDKTDRLVSIRPTHYYAQNLLSQYLSFDTPPPEVLLS